MILIATVDDRNGLTFNNRRQSQDRILREHILEDPMGSKLWMDTYSAGQFNGLPAYVSVNDRWPVLATKGDFAFLEQPKEGLDAARIEKIILYKWNRAYPGDTFFPINLGKEWKLISTEDFPGYSHEKITKEEWIPCTGK